MDIRILRWIPTVAMMLVSLISYIDRNTLALLAPTILAETKLSGEQYGFILSAFSIAYMLGNPIWGRALDRVGVRWGMVAAVAIWSVASASHAFAAGFISFAVARSMLGFGEGATFPGCLRTVLQTLPAALRARGTALSYSGGALGAVITPILITPIAAMWTWRGAFWFTGAVGAAWVSVWLLVSRTPELARHRRSSTKAPATLPFRDTRLWGYMSAWALGGAPIAFVLYYTSVYLSKELHKDQVSIGHVLWIPPLGLELGFFFWGWVTDRFGAHGESDVAMRRILAVLALLSIPVAFTHRLHALPAVLGTLFLVMFVAGGFVIAAVAYGTSIFSSENSGLLAGLGAGAWSAGVALLMPVFGKLFDLQLYDAAFGLAAGLPVVGWIGWRAGLRSG